MTQSSRLVLNAEDHFQILEWSTGNEGDLPTSEETIARIPEHCSQRDNEIKNFKQLDLIEVVNENNMD